jgi:hypothetical protein
MQKYVARILLDHAAHAHTSNTPLVVGAPVRIHVFAKGAHLVIYRQTHAIAYHNVIGIPPQKHFHGAQEMQWISTQRPRIRDVLQGSISNGLHKTMDQKPFTECRLFHGKRHRDGVGGNLYR